MVEQRTLEQTMFADSMLETSWAQRSRRSWTTIASFGLEALIVGLLLLVPVLRTVGLPAGRILPTPLSWGAPAPAPRRVNVSEHRITAVQSNLADNMIIEPHEIPRQVAIINEVEPPPQLSFGGVGVPGATGDPRNRVWSSLNDMASRGVLPPASAPAPNVRPTRISKMLEGSLIRRVTPLYPPLAKSARIQGEVVLSAIISKAGTIEDLQVVSGHPLLVTAAIEAVRQWRYRPYILNNEPVEVETQIMVNFTLSGN